MLSSYQRLNLWIFARRNVVVPVDYTSPWCFNTLYYFFMFCDLVFALNYSTPHTHTHNILFSFSNLLTAVLVKLIYVLFVIMHVFIYHFATSSLISKRISLLAHIYRGKLYDANDECTIWLKSVERWFSFCKCCMFVPLKSYRISFIEIWHSKMKRTSLIKSMHLLYSPC